MCYGSVQHIVVLELVLLTSFKSYYKMSMRTLNHLIRWRNCPRACFINKKIVLELVLLTCP